jgi:hypothetical protein
MIEEEIGVRLSYTEVFDSPTISELAAKLEERILAASRAEVP